MRKRCLIGWGLRFKNETLLEAVKEHLYTSAEEPDEASLSIYTTKEESRLQRHYAKQFRGAEPELFRVYAEADIDDRKA